MSLRSTEIQVVAQSLSLLEGTQIQKIHAPVADRVWLDVRAIGESILLHFCVTPQLGRVTVVDQRMPGTPGVVPGFQQVLRRELTGARLEKVEALPYGFVLHWERKEKIYLLVADFSDSALALVGPTGVLLGVSNVRGHPLYRHGARWEKPLQRPNPLPSRIPEGLTGLGPARAAEQLFDKVERTDAQQSAKSPLVQELKKLERTRAKIQAEAARASKSADYQRDGTLLARNLHLIQRGAESISLTDYLPDGEIVERHLKLDPAKSPKQQVDWFFHQAKRLTRGAAMAQGRLDALDVKAADLRARIAALEKTAPDPSLPSTPAPAEAQGRALPYREYVTPNGRVWVGRGSEHNDTLTFKVARPFHVWFHARGVPGAHVVVPLGKNETLDQELLLDAAHLATHHSDSKGEPKAEVSYTPVKYLRKPKGAAPGAVTFTQEKTFVLRVDAARLKRLLDSQSPLR